MYGQESKTGYGVTSDSTESNYQNQDALGGPKTIGAQLKADNQKKESFFRVPIRIFKPWYDWKKKVQENTGLQIGINYTSVFMRSSAVIDESNQRSTGGGILDIQLGWNLVGREAGKNKGIMCRKDITLADAYSDRPHLKLDASLLSPAPSNRGFCG